MEKFSHRRLAAAVVTVSTMFLGTLAAPGAEATPSTRGGRDRLPDLIAGRDRQFHGRAALAALGDRLPEAARRNGMAAERLHEILTRDPSAWLDQDARLLYEEPARTEGATAAPTAEAAAPAPLAQTFQLHSKPGSQRTIYLDFDGQNVSNSVWNVNHGLTAGSHPAWSLDTDRSNFNTAEREAVQSIWQRVSEDYAPFDVDVTTQDPGALALTRTDGADAIFGTRALISPSTSASSKLCGGACGGIAYTGVFDTTNSGYFEPAWIFPQSLANDAKSIAEAVSHEVGHNLGLTHDGLTGGTSYYAGHATWAPIMGIGYSRPITQWSKGDYKGANNGQDDLSVITNNGLSLRTDEAGSTPSPTTRPPTGFAYITSDADRDVYALGTCDGPLTLAAKPVAQSPDLDLKLSLLDVTGGTVATDNPTSRAGTPSRDVAAGMDAAVSRTVTDDWYFVAVEGVGNGTASKGYDGYASIGAYSLSIRGTCQSSRPELPSAPQTVQASAAGSSATVAWSAPASTGASSITSYVVTRDGSAPVTVPAQSLNYTYSDLQPGATDKVAVQAVNSAGEGAPAAVVVRVPAAKPLHPRTRRASRGATGGKRTAIARWKEPLSNGGAKVDGYRVYGYRLNASGAVVQTVTSSVRSPKARSWQPTLRKGRWQFAFSARNSVGWSDLSRRSNTVRAR
ncbi:MAG TPA: fibronectin type III domain-containing protein [Nocardioides sp.]|nr:fibronectin type III domain-containing protein [Nocardioides sp.]